MSQASSEIMATGARIHASLNELFAILNSPTSLPFAAVVISLQNLTIRRFQVDFASNVATSYVNERMTLEVDIPRFNGATSDNFDTSKIAEASGNWVTGVEGRDGGGSGTYAAFARGCLQAGVANVYTFLPAKGQRSGKILYVGKSGDVHTEAFNL